MTKHVVALMLFAATTLTSYMTWAAEQSCTLSVENMSCASCPYIIKQTLTSVPGVKDVSVSFEDKTAVIVYDDEQVDVTVLTEATTNLGFPARLVE